MCLRTCKNFRDKTGKALFVRKRVIEDIFEVCTNINRESLSTALSFMCAYGYKGATTILIDVVKEVSAVSVKRGVNEPCSMKHERRCNHLLDSLH